MVTLSQEPNRGQRTRCEAPGYTGYRCYAGVARVTARLRWRSGCGRSLHCRSGLSPGPDAGLQVATNEAGMCLTPKELRI